MRYIRCSKPTKNIKNLSQLRFLCEFTHQTKLNLCRICTAEGIGSTEADDIREAITRCLNGL